MSVDTTPYPEGEQLRRSVARRNGRARRFRFGFVVSLMISVLALATLLVTILNDSFGLVAVVEDVSEEEIAAGVGRSGDSLESFSKEELVEILGGFIKINVGRRLERDQRFFADRLAFESQEVWDEVCAREEAPAGCEAGARTQGDVYALVLERVVNPDIVATFTYWRSITDRAGVEAELVEINAERRAKAADAGELEEFKDASLRMRSWVSRSFLTRPQSPRPEIAGVRTAILGSLWVVVITIVFALPVGVGAAVYMEEYAVDSRLNRIIQTNINNLAGVPSIIYGMLGLAVFVRLMVTLTSGSAFGVGGEGTANGRTILSAGLTLGLLILPLVIINAQEAIKAVPRSLRDASYGLGATKWQTVRAHVLPNAVPGILTGAILSVARALGETAPLVVVGASTFITFDPTGPFSKFTVLPIQIFQWTSRPQDEFRNLAAAAIVVLLVLLFTLNATAVVLRNRYSRRT